MDEFVQSLPPKAPGMTSAQCSTRRLLRGGGGMGSTPAMNNSLNCKNDERFTDPVRVDVAALGDVWQQGGGACVTGDTSISSGLARRSYFTPRAVPEGLCSGKTRLYITTINCAASKQDLIGR